MPRRSGRGGSSIAFSRKSWRDEGGGHLPKGLDAAGSFPYTEKPPNPLTKKERDMSLRLGDTAPDFTAYLRLTPQPK